MNDFGETFEGYVIFYIFSKFNYRFDLYTLKPRVCMYNIDIIFCLMVLLLSNCLY